MLKYIIRIKEGYNIIFDIEEMKNSKQLEQTFIKSFEIPELIIFMKIINIIIAMTELRLLLLRLVMSK